MLVTREFQFLEHSKHCHCSASAVFAWSAFAASRLCCRLRLTLLPPLALLLLLGRALLLLPECALLRLERAILLLLGRALVLLLWRALTESGHKL